MDGNQSNAVSNAGATRKRRSSILKSQRPPRTPFSELEFNVATPTDATKSRRVSFSRKTGVAEFATNEATTTWKNFYEEQNKSLESSGNEVERPPRPSVLGNRLFDQQFQEVEAEIDFGSFAANPMACNTSLNNVNITEQIAMLESADDKLADPSNKFELSAFTENNTKIVNELTIPTMGMGADSGRIDVNFSNLNTIGSIHGDNDDLDEIERDLEISRPKIVGPAYAGEVSQYIEFDLNGTQGPLRGNESDMSITDTIHSPKKEVSKSISITDRNWVEDKENIVVNPYVTPAESDNFAVNDETSQVLVFDGRKLKYADINADLDEVVEDVKNYNKPDGQSKRQTIVFGSQDADISITQCIPNQIKSNNTIVFHEDNAADMSVTQAVPNHILKTGENIQSQKRQTIVFDDINADISITQAIPNKILSPQRKRQTIVFANDGADISMTQCIPNAVISGSATVFEDNIEPKIKPKRQTIVFANNDGEISMTQAIPTNILNRKSLKPENTQTNEVQTKQQTIVFDNDNMNGDISMTQAISTNILQRKSLKPDNSANNELQTKRQTIVFENDNMDADISMTQAIPTNILQRKSLKPENIETNEPQKKRQTAVFDNNNMDADISMTQAIPTNILHRKSLKPENVETSEFPAKRQTIVFDNDNMAADISITQAIPSNILNRKSLMPQETQTTEKMFSNDDNFEISMTQAIPSNILSSTGMPSKRQTIVFSNDDDNADISMTQAIPTNIVNSVSMKSENGETTNNQRKRQTIVFENDLNADISVTQTIESNILSRKSINPKITKLEETDVYMSEKIVQKQTNVKRESLNTVNPDTNKNTDVLTNRKEQINEKSNTPKDAPEKSPNNTSNFEPDHLQNFSHTHQNNFSNLRQSYKPETLVYTVTSIDTSDNSISMPSSKGDDFHASSQKIDIELQSGLENPLTTSHCYKAPNVKTKKPAESVESKYEAAINSISYEANLSASESKDTEQNEICSSSVTQSQESASDYKSCTESKKSILNELLDMSDTSFADGFEDKDVMAKPNVETVKVALISSMKNASFMDVEESSETYKKSSEVSMKVKNSDNSLFLIMRDSNDELQSNEINKITEIQEPAVKTEYLDKNINKLLQDKTNLQDVMQSKAEITQHKSFSEDSPNEKIDKEEANKSTKVDLMKSFKNANDTRELLEILSNLTDKTINEVSPRKATSANKCEQTKHLTFATDFTSLTSKDTLSEALSKYSELDEDVPETPAQPVRKSVRLSHDVVKTLHFEDEITNKSPLKKTAFGETSYMSDKSKVIPSFANTCDGIKEIMDELVKPMADVLVPLPSKADKAVHRNASTCSTQIQANLVSSSQIDLELSSSSSNNDLIKNLASGQGHDSISKVLHHAINPSKSIESYEENKKGTELEKVIIFDQNNPLNNVLLAPTDFDNAHPYKNVSEESYTLHNDLQYEIERVSLALDSERTAPLENIQEEISSTKSEDFSATVVVDSVVNTDIVMKGNKELLEETSCLTLVDESESDMEVDEPQTNSPVKVIYQVDNIEDEISRKRNYSPIQATKDTSIQGVTPKPLSKVQRLSHSPISINISVKPTNKSPKTESPRSPKTSPITRSSSKKWHEKSPQREAKIQTHDFYDNTITVKRLSMNDDKDPISNDNTAFMENNCRKEKSPKKLQETRSPKVILLDQESPKKEDKSSPKKKQELYKRHAVVTVQRMAVEPALKSDVTSYASVESFKDTQSIISSSYKQSNAATQSSSSVGKVSRSTNSDVETSTNVVAKIDMLPFMGTKLCEWDTACMDTMSFRVLHSRVRVAVRLDHRHDNAARTHVRADTPVQECTAKCMLSDMQPKDMKSVIASLSVQHAAGAIQYYMRGVRRAGDIPELLKRCAGVAESALRWARWMFEAYIQLAFTLNMDGDLTLKVCNVPLRSVWEVRLHISLCSDHGSPHPRASAVAGSRVVGEPPGDLAGAADAVPPGWGHAPQTIWKVFRHLKNQKADVALSLV